MQILSIPRKKRIYSLAFSPSGRELAAACGDGNLRVWNLATGQVRQSIPIEETQCGYDLVYLDEDRLVFAGLELRWWDIPANGWNVIEPSRRWSRQLRVSPDGRYLAEVDRTTSTDSGGDGLRVRVITDWEPLESLSDPTDTAGGLAFAMTVSTWRAATSSAGVSPATAEPVGTRRHPALLRAPRRRRTSHTDRTADRARGPR